MCVLVCVFGVLVELCEFLSVCVCPDWTFRPAKSEKSETLSLELLRERGQLSVREGVCVASLSLGNYNIF